jgi:hypothetical protein
LADDEPISDTAVGGGEIDDDDTGFISGILDGVNDLFSGGGDAPGGDNSTGGADGTRAGSEETGDGGSPAENINIGDGLVADAVGGQSNLEVLKTFAGSPVGFIIGAVLSPVVSGIQLGIVSVIDALDVVFTGTDPGTDGQLGLADLPLFLGETAFDVLAPRPRGETTVGDALLTIPRTYVDFVTDLATQAGPAEPVVQAAGAAGGIVAIGYLTRLTLAVGADLVPGLGGVI